MGDAGRLVDLCDIAQKQAYTKDKAIQSHMICLNDNI